MAVTGTFTGNLTFSATAATKAITWPRVLKIAYGHSGTAVYTHLFPYAPQGSFFYGYLANGFTDEKGTEIPAFGDIQEYDEDTEEFVASNPITGGIYIYAMVTYLGDTDNQNHIFIRTSIPCKITTSYGDINVTRRADGPTYISAVETEAEYALYNILRGNNSLPFIEIEPFV